jgi:hypothetical protein
MLLSGWEWLLGLVAASLASLREWIAAKAVLSL